MTRRNAVAMVMALALCFGLAACGDNGNDGPRSTGTWDLFFVDFDDTGVLAITENDNGAINGTLNVPGLATFNVTGSANGSGQMSFTASNNDADRLVFSMTADNDRRNMSGNASVTLSGTPFGATAVTGIRR